MSTTDAPPMPDPAEAERLVTEMWVLLSIVTLITILRTFSSLRNNGYKQLKLDDYFVWLGLLCFGAECALAYNLGDRAHGLANNAMSDEYRAALSPDSDEYSQRQTGSMIHIGGWSVYSLSLWSLKASWLVLYSRLTSGLGKGYRLRIRIGAAFIAGTWVAGLMSQFLSCRPFNHYWQISPDPGNICQPAVSNSIVWVWYSFNVATDLYLLSIPIPMLWAARLKTWKKFSLIFLFSGGIFVIICATLRAVLIVTDPVDGTMTAGAWGVRETFVAITTTNLPLVFALFRAYIGPYIGISPSTKETSRKQTDGTGGDASRSHLSGVGARNSNWRGHSSAQPYPDVTMNESEERIMKYGIGTAVTDDVERSAVSDEAERSTIGATSPAMRSATDMPSAIEMNTISGKADTHDRRG